MTTIEARLVAAGVGLPPVWLDAEDKYLEARYCVTEDTQSWDGCVLDLSDPQTAFGVALQLDMWEGNTSWSSGVVKGFRKPEQYADYRQRCLAALGAHVEYIGLDHLVRRRLGWRVEPGTLAMLKKHADGWYFSIGVTGCGFYPTSSEHRQHRVVPGLVDIDHNEHCKTCDGSCKEEGRNLWGDRIPVPCSGCKATGLAREIPHRVLRVIEETLR